MNAEIWTKSLDIYHPRGRYSSNAYILYVPLEKISVWYTEDEPEFHDNDDSNWQKDSYLINRITISNSDMDGLRNIFQAKKHESKILELIYRDESVQKCMRINDTVDYTCIEKDIESIDDLLQRGHIHYRDDVKLPITSADIDGLNIVKDKLEEFLHRIEFDTVLLQRIRSEYESIYDNIIQRHETRTTSNQCTLN